MEGDGRSRGHGATRCAAAGELMARHRGVGRADVTAVVIALAALLALLDLTDGSRHRRGGAVAGARGVPQDLPGHDAIPLCLPQVWLGMWPLMTLAWDLSDDGKRLASWRVQ